MTQANTSEPTAINTNVVIPTITLTAIICPDVSGPFAGLWTAVQDRLGCQENNHLITWVAEGTFENGWMYWRKDNRHVYVVYDDRTWAAYNDTWYEGDPVYTCGNEPSPPTHIQGFGKVWGLQSGVRDKIGWAKESVHRTDTCARFPEWVYITY